MEGSAESMVSGKEGVISRAWKGGIRSGIRRRNGAEGKEKRGKRKQEDRKWKAIVHNDNCC